MFGIKKLLQLSEEGWRNFTRAVIACVLTNLTLLLPFGVIIHVITLLLGPLAGGSALETAALWRALVLGAAAALLYLFALRYEYRKTYMTAYSESEQIRLDVAERLRRLPLSFFNKKDLAELTANIMGDCTAIEHTMSHVTPGLCANIITITLASALLALYDWRMAAAHFAPLPAAFGLILVTRGLQTRLGERHVRAKLEAAEQVQEYLEGIKVVKAFGLAGEKSAALKNALRAMMTKPRRALTRRTKRGSRRRFPRWCRAAR